MKKNFVKMRWLFTMLLFVAAMLIPSIAWADNITPTIPNGEGTAENPYQIGTAAELYWFAGLVNGTLEDERKNASADAILTANIIVNTGVLDANKNLVNESDFIEWTPVGKSRNDPYTGTFDGKGYTVSGLYFNNPNSWYVGLFGCIGANGKISNVGVLDSYFQFKAQGGGVCGMNNYGELLNCSNSSTVIGNGSAGTGGVCGMNYGTVRECKNTGSVSGTSRIGGVCAYNYSKIENCFNEGTVSGTENSVGGVCGYNCTSASTINSCYNTASVSGTENRVGGVCGSNYGTITNCYYLNGTATGGMEGTDVNGSAEGKSTEQFKSGEVVYLLNEGKAFGTQAWGQQLEKDQYPVLGSDYKVIRAAWGNKDANGNDTYWATFSNTNSDSDLGELNIYTAKVSEGNLTITRCSNKIVAHGEGVLVKGSSEYLNAQILNTNTETAETNNDLVATPEETEDVTAETGHVMYRLTYDNVANQKDLGFYYAGTDGTTLKATPNKAYLNVTTADATKPSSAALARSFVFDNDSETTGIEGITIIGTDLQRHNTLEGIFDLQGRKISNPTKGIYIKNNKKVIIK